MRILILTHSYPEAGREWRGIFIREQAGALAVRHEVTVLFTRVDYSSFAPFGDCSATRIRNGNLEEISLTIKRSFPVVSQLKYLLDTWRFIRKENRESGFSPDIIHSHLSYPAGFFGTFIARRLGIRSLLTEHSWIKKHFRSPVHRFCVKYALKHSNAVVAVSEALAADIRLYVKREILVIPNVVDTSKFVLRQKATSDKLHFGLLGGMSNYRKGADILIRAAAIIKNKTIIFHIGGDGTLLPEFRKLASDLGIPENVVFHGKIIQDELQAFYSSLDCFVLASRDETFGVVAIEAMACGLPVIATRCGGPAEIISPGTGILIEKDDPAALADAIDYMAKNLASFNRPEIRNLAEKRYGREAFTMKMTSIYESLVSMSAK